MQYAWEMLTGKSHLSNNNKNNTFPETNIAPKSGWLEYYTFLLGRPIFRCYVSFREGNRNKSKNNNKHNQYK